MMAWRDAAARRARGRVRRPARRSVRGQRDRPLIPTPGTAAVYVVEDAHWIDEVSESMLDDFFTVIPQTPSLVVLTYRPEYRGALSRVADAQTIALAPLRDSETVELITELLGPDPSITGWGQRIAEWAAGNPFFAEEI